jgi:tetratricopeptide (TPR) repeat protein
MASRPKRPLVVLAALMAVTGAPLQALAQPAERPAAAPPPVTNSSMDALLFYQLLLGELELANGKAGTAYELVLEAARRTRHDDLFRRAVDIAVQGRAGDQALAAARSWRVAKPGSADATRTEVQLLGALDRLSEAAEPMRTLVAQTPPAERGAMIAAMPRAVQRASDRRRAAQLVQDALAPLAKDASLAVPVQLATARAWLTAGDGDRALTLARDAQRSDPTAPGAALLALELLPTKPEAEEIVRSHFASGKAEAPIRLAYVRSLMGQQRYVEAVSQLDTAVREQPDVAAPYLTLGALHLELRQFDASEVALKRYVELQQGAASPVAQTSARDDDDDADRPEQGLVEAWLLLSRVAEQRGDFKAAEDWLARIEDPQRVLEVQSRRALILARQGRLADARAAFTLIPERTPEDAKAKAMAEAAMLREVKQWQDAWTVLSAAATRAPEDAELLYEQAMVAEKLDRHADAERLLRRAIEVKPESAHAYNALGYSLADRGQRLPEARDLIARALALSPGDPFITDSLGWVEFRLGNHAEALRLLRLAYASRPDVEIAAHLGEVLWTLGQHDEARKVWAEGRTRDASNEVLKETLARLKVQP